MVAIAILPLAFPWVGTNLHNYNGILIAKATVQQVLL